MINLITKTKRRKSPIKTLIVGHPKIGKTEMLAKLTNSAILDLQSGTAYADDTNCTFFDVRTILRENNAELIDGGEKPITKIDVYYEITNHLRKNPVDYLSVDTSSDLEDLAKVMALYMYKASPMGKKYKGTDVTTLPNGAGYNWVRIAFEKLTSELEGCYTKGLIYTVHPKNASITKNGEDISARDINLTGKLKTILCGEVDAVGFVYRDKGSNTNVISFKTSERDLASGARPKHLRGQEFPISKLLDDGTLETYWDKVFID
jgi:hypothetical protein